MSNIYHKVTISIWFALVSSFANGQILSYEANELPEQSGWDIFQIYCNPGLSIENGWFVNKVDVCPGKQPPDGQMAAYTRSIEEFNGETQYFFEFRVVTSAPRSENLWGGGAMASSWSFGRVNYAFSVTADQVELNRDNRLPIVLVDVEPGVPHTIRLEQYGESLYIFYVDNKTADSGIPEGPYPSSSPHVNLVTAAAWVPNETRWDYIRYGRIAEDGSGDFDSDGDIDLRDAFYFVECLDSSGPAAGSGPGCRWADIDGDADTDLRDFSKLQNNYTGSK